MFHHPYYYDVRGRRRRHPPRVHGSSSSTRFHFLLLLTALTPLFCSAVFNGEKVATSADVPGVSGALFQHVPGNLDVATCMNGDEKVSGSCSGGLISPGIFLTAAHCFTSEMQKGDPKDFANLRVALGRKYPYANDDGTCAGRELSEKDGIYKVKAVFWAKDFKAYQYERGDVAGAIDHVDYAVVYLDTCVSATTLGSAKPAIAGAAFSDLKLMAGGAAGLNTKFWGFGENDEGKTNFDGSVRLMNSTWVRSTSPTSGQAGKKNIWVDCSWLPDSAAVWKYSDGLDAAKSSTTLKATPMFMCQKRNPDGTKRCSQITNQADCLAAKKTTKAPIKSFCKWDGTDCSIDADVGGGNGVLTLPTPGGGDSGGALYVVKDDKYVHVGVSSGASEYYPRFDVAYRTDYAQNWLKLALDADKCVGSGNETDYFEGYAADSDAQLPFTAANFHGGLSTGTSFGDLSLLGVKTSPPPPPMPPPPPTMTTPPPTTPNKTDDMSNSGSSSLFSAPRTPWTTAAVLVVLVLLAPGLL